MSVRFFVSWYLGDPLYPTYVEDCALLLSPTSLSRDWTLRNFPEKPSQLILDSGAFRYLNSNEQPPTPATLLERQLAILDGHNIPTLLCPLDSPIVSGIVASADVDRQVSRTLAHAYELQRLITRHPLPDGVEPLAIVQGNDPASLTYCARELLTMGYQTFGIGSLARVPDIVEIRRRVATVYDIIQRPLHLFGVASPHVLHGINSFWVSSVDSSLPARAAACNELLYSHPFRRYGIMTEDGKSRSKFPASRCIRKPLMCDCPICTEDRNAVVRIGRRDHIRARAVHNYHHLRSEIEEIGR